MDFSKLPDLSQFKESTEVANTSVEYSKPLEEYTNPRILIELIDNLHCNDSDIDNYIDFLSFEDYLCHESLSSSFLKKAYESTPYELYYNTTKTENDNKKCFELGTFIHEAILEPEKFKNVLPLIPCNRTKIEDLKNLYLQYQSIDFEYNFIDASNFKIGQLREVIKEYESKTKYSFIEYRMIEAIKAIKHRVDSYSNNLINKILQNSIAESSIFCNYNSCKLKVRPDSLITKESHGLNAIISVKSTRRNNLKGFYYDFNSLHYDLSEAMYQEVVSQKTGRNFDVTLMIVVQTVEPYDVALIYIDPETIEKGKVKFNYALEKYDYYKKNPFTGNELYSRTKDGIINFNEIINHD